MKICPKCKSTLHSERDIFCYVDGEKLIENPYKCNCGEELLSSNKFCPHCGKKVNHGTN